VTLTKGAMLVCLAGLALEAAVSTWHSPAFRHWWQGCEPALDADRDARLPWCWYCKRLLP
jgi:hypothetical protein